MDVALASLDRGVRALFTESIAALVAASTHPLCECILQQAPPPDWRYLVRCPVLKRHVLAEFRSVAVEMAKMPQTPRKRKKRGSPQQSRDADEYQTLCLASLCQKLAQCELLTVNEAELVENVVKLESLDVLRQVIGGKLLPLRLRILLLSFVLREQGIKCLELKVQSWIQEVCEKILEEVLEATATRGASELPRKRSRTRSDDKKIEGAVEVEKSCNFCRDGARAESLRSKCGGWEFLVECTQQTAQILEKAGESYATNQAMLALSAFWDSLPIAGLTASVKTGKRRKRFEISVKNEEEVESSMTVAAYKRICEMTSAGGELHGKEEAYHKMWTSVWERELKNMVKAKQITLVDAIRHCSKADAFASIVLPPEMKGRGFRAVMEVIRSLSLGISSIITAFAHVWSAVGVGCRDAFSQITIPPGGGASPTKRILKSYISELLKSPRVQLDVVPSPVDKLPASSRTSPLKLLIFLYEIFSESEIDDQQDGSCSGHWDVLMTQHDSDSSTKEDGINWCLFLGKCVLNLDTKTLIHCSSGFLGAFKRYCRAIMHGIIASGGEVISSGGIIQLRLITVESDRSVVRDVLAQMMTIFGEDWTSCLIAQILRASAGWRSTGDVYQRGMKNLLFPALVACMKSTSKGNPKGRKTGQQQFTDIVNAANSIVKESEPTPLYLVSLLRFCEAWDAYQSTHTKDPPTRANRWGFRSMVELDMLPQLLECYDRDEVVCQQTNEALVFAAEVLQNSPNCPQSLERSLCKVLSAVKAGAEHAKTFVYSLLGAPDEDLVSHSSDVLKRLLRVVKCADLAQTRQLMNQVKDSVGTLLELRQQLERWFSFVEMHGTAFAGKESRLELSLLCTRLIRWFPDEFGSMRFLLMSPLDSQLMFALKAFVKEAGRPGNMERQSVVNSTARAALPSAVRVEMALHLYLSAAAFPDLETLTILLIKAMVKCRSPGAFDHLMKVTQKNGWMLLPEVALSTLSPPLRGLEFSSSALIQQDGDLDDDQINNHARHAKSIIYQENTLKLLTASACIFKGGISWSTLLFGEKSAVTWLPHFFEYILKTEFCEGSLRADLLLTSLEELIETPELGKKVLGEAYWLAALLNTTLVSCSRRCAGAFADVEGGILDRLRTITGNVLQLLSIAHKATMSNGEGNLVVQHDGEILGLLNVSKCANLSIEDNGASWIRAHLISDKSATAVRRVVSETWSTEAPPRIQEPSNQLFVPFSHWLSGALVYSQSFLEEPSAIMRRWERTFSSYVTDLYLPLEFEDITCNLLKSWLTTWVTSNIVRGQEELQLLALLPTQVALFRRLGLTPYRSSSPHGEIPSIWRLIFVAVNLSLDHHTDENPTGIEQATELVISTLTTLELFDLSASSDFVHFNNIQEIEPLFEELEQFLSRPQLRVCSADQVCCLLQYPLEVLVCCYACKISTHLETESHLFLQRVKKVLHENFSPTEAQLTEMDAFFQYWADEMLLKYDYLDRDRCTTVLEVILAAVQINGGLDVDT